MQVFLIVAPVFALIVIGYAGAASRLFSENAHKGIAEYAFSIAIPALLFRTIAVADTGDIEPFRLWASYFGAVVATWVLATLITRGFLKRPAADGAAIAISGANAYIFAMRYQRVVNSASGAVALGTVLAAFTAAVLVLVLPR